MKRIFTFFAFMLFLKMAIGQVSVTITVHDNMTYEFVPGAIVSLPEALIPTDTTDASGVATFQVPAPDADKFYTYTVTYPGYLDYKNEWLYIEPISTQLYSSAYLKKAFDITFKVTDNADVNIANAIVTINSQPVTTDTTDINGEVSFNQIYSGGYHEYVITADGFADSTATLQINNSSENPVIVPTIKLKNAYNLTFSLTDGVNPIQDANVKIGDIKVTTDADGKATFTKKINGDYEYLISKTGYIDVTGVATVADSDELPAITMLTGFDLTFNIINGKDGEVGLQNDTITVDGITKISDETGIITFGVAAGTNVSFTNAKAGFISVPVTIENIQANTTKTINMIPVYNVVIRVLDNNSYNPMPGISVVFNGVEKLSDVDGFTYYSNVEPSDTAYKYTVTGTGNYSSIDTEISLPFTSPGDYLYSNNVVNISAGLSSPGVFIALVNGWMSYFGSATVFFDDIEYIYDSGLGGAIITCSLGTHTYVVTPEDETKAIITGTIDVLTNESVYLPLNVVDGRNLEIYTIDEAQNPVEGATVTLNGTPVITDESGLAAFNRIADGNYTYSVTKEGFKSIEETTLEVNADNTLKIITLTQSYSITFNVTNKSTALAGVTVTCDGETATTNEAGIAVFTEKTAGTYSYTIEKTGYDMISGSTTVTNANVSENIDIIITGIRDISENAFKVYPNPTSGIVYVALSNDIKNTAVKVSVLNIAGAVVFENKSELSAQNIKLDISNFSNGVYYVKLSGDTFEKTFKVIKN